MRAKVNTKKHFVQYPIDVTPMATIKNITLARSVSAPASSDEVTEGASISAIFVELWLLAGSQQPGNFIVTLEKRMGSMAAMTTVNASDLQNYTNKKNIFYTTEGLIGDANSNPTPVLRQWFKIPKSKQRFGLEDALILNISAGVEDITTCGFSTYKEQF